MQNISQMQGKTIELKQPIMKDSVLPKKLLKACEKVREYYPYMADVSFYAPFSLNGLGVLSLEGATAAVFGTDIVYRVANITACTEKLIQSKATKKKIEKHIEDYKIRNKSRDYIVKEENKPLKIDDKAIERRERYLEFALKDEEIKKDFRVKMEKELLEIREYIVNLNIKKKLNKILRDVSVKTGCETIKLAGDGVLVNVPLWLYGVIVKVTGTLMEMSYLGTKKVIKKGREKAYWGEEGNVYSKIFNAKKSKIEKFRKLKKDVETIKHIQKKVEENKLTDEQQKERYNEYIKFYGNNLDELLIKKKYEIFKDSTIFEKLFAKYFEQNFDTIFYTSETLDQNDIVGKPISQFAQRGYLVGVLIREVTLLEHKIFTLKVNKEKLRRLEKELSHVVNVNREKEFIKYLKRVNKKEKKYLKKRVSNDLVKISGDLTRFSGAFGTNELNVAGMLVRLTAVFVDLAIIARHEAQKDKDILKYVNLINELCNIVEIKKDYKVEQRLKKYMEIMGCSYNDVIKIKDEQNRMDYIKGIILGN